MEKKIGKLSIRVLLNTHRRNDCEIYPLIIRVVYHRRKSEYSLGWKIHTSNFSADRERVVYSSTGNLKRKDLGLINDAISQERERLLKIFAFPMSLPLVAPTSAIISFSAASNSSALICLGR